MKMLLVAPVVAFMLAGCTADVYHTDGAPSHPNRDVGFAFRIFVVDEQDKTKEDTMEAYAGFDLPDFITQDSE